MQHMRPTPKLESLSILVQGPILKTFSTYGSLETKIKHIYLKRWQTWMREDGGVASTAFDLELLLA